MKQFNVRDETHKLGRELSLATGKSLLDVVNEALEMYKKSFEATQREDEFSVLTDSFLERASDVWVHRILNTVFDIVHEEVPRAVEVVVKKLRVEQKRIEGQQVAELERLLDEAEADKAAADGAG